LADIKRNLQDGDIYIDKWWTGLYKNRSPLFTPVSVTGITLIARRDALIDGQNMAISPQYSLKRRYGFSKACNVAFGANEWPLAFASFQQLNGNIIPIVDTQIGVYTFGPTSKTLIYTKLTGAVQSSFVSDLVWLYWVDGVSANKFDGTTVFNLSITAPTSAPTINTVQSGSAGTQWQASTWFSTMGIMVDSNNNAEQLININNGTQFGKSSTGQPPWVNTPGQTTSEVGPVRWINEGLLHDWQKGFYKYFADNTTYAAPGAIWDTPHGVAYFQVFNNGAGNLLPTNPASGVGPGVRPPFSGAISSTYIDNFCTWQASPVNGAFPNVKAWAPSHVYSTNDRVYQPSIPPSTSQTPVYLMRCTTGGTSDASFSSAAFSLGVGQTTNDNELQWINLGSAVRLNAHSYAPWTSAQSHTFGCIKDSLGGAGGAGNLQVCIGALVNGVVVLGGTGTTGIAPPASWATAYGAQTVDGSVVWVCVGSDTGWQSNTIHYLPASGFNAPVQVTGLGGAQIIEGSPSIQQFVISTGVSQTPGPPSWNNAVNATTTDGTVTWRSNGPQLANSLAWSKGYAYAYSYKARSLTDFYSVATGNPPTLPVPPGSTFGSLPAPTGSKSGGVSTASPAAFTAPSNAGAENILTLIGSTDPQVDTIVIWRSKDGGGSSNMFELTEIPNPAVVNGQPGTTSYTDFQPDSVLNTQILAPIANANNPLPTGVTSTGAPAGATILVWHAGRLWAAVGNILYFSGGPDTAPGVGQESWPPGNNFVLPGLITALTSTTSGLIISVNDDQYVTTGSTSGTFTVPILWQANFGVASQNCVAQDGDNVFFFTVRGQVWHFSANGLAEIGYLNAKDFAAMTPASVYIAIHRSGEDEGLFVSDGSTNLWRYSQNSSSWDATYTPVGGVRAVGSIETSNGTWNLLIGRPTGAGFILKRDLSLYVDDGQSYRAFATVGSLVTAPPRKVADVSAILIQAKVVGTYPTVSVMCNEITDISVFPATFTVLPNPVVDPPQLVGYQNTLFMKRHDFNAAQKPLPHYVQHLQVKIDFGNDTVGNELLGLGIA
jgi:hypothetical protein